MNWENRTLFRGDNLECMRSMNSGSVHLVATDPPFDKGGDFHAAPESLARGASFSDWWRWDEDVQPEWLDRIQDDWPAAWAVIDSSRATYGDDMAAFMCFMAVRPMALRRILRDDGSVYLHCDPTASHYLKMPMDAIFGRKRFRNEIIWKRSAGRAKGSQHAPRSFGSGADTLLFYTKGDKYTFHGCYSPLTENEIEKKFPYEDERGRYNTDVPLFRQPSMGPRPNLCCEYRGVRNPHPSGWRVGKETLVEMDGRNGIVWRDGKRPLRKTYADSCKGKPRGNLWDDIPNITGGAEATSCPTQKPLALYRRIILASSNPGDIVFDPFAGCAATSVAAEMEGRQWVACDEWEDAYNVVKRRLESTSVGGAKGAMPLYPIVQRSEPSVRTDSGETSAPPLKPLRRKASPPRMKRSEMMAVLVERDGMQCQGRGRKFDSQRYLELDRKMPRSEGGSNGVENRVLLCGPCNRTKSNTLTLTGLRKQNRRDGFLAAPLKRSRLLAPTLACRQTPASPGAWRQCHDGIGGRGPPAQDRIVSEGGRESDRAAMAAHRRMGVDMPSNANYIVANRLVGNNIVGAHHAHESRRKLGFERPILRPRRRYRVARRTRPRRRAYAARGTAPHGQDELDSRSPASP